MLRPDLKELSGASMPVEGRYTFKIDFQFKGFEGKSMPRVVAVNLEDPQFDRLRSSLEIHEHHPTEALIIYVGDVPKLVAVYGNRERWQHEGYFGEGARTRRLQDTKYLHILKADPIDSIIIQGDRMHRFDDRDGRGFDVEDLLPMEHRAPGSVQISRDRQHRIILSRTYGRNI